MNTNDITIPDEAVTAALQRFGDWLMTQDVGLDEWERLGPWKAGEVIRSVLEAALPVVLADRDTETAALRDKVTKLQGIARRLVDERDEMQRTTTRQMRKIGDLVSEIEKLNSHPYCTSEIDGYGCALLRGHDEDCTNGSRSWANPRAASLRGEA